MPRLPSTSWAPKPTNASSTNCLISRPSIPSIAISRVIRKRSIGRQPHPPTGTSPESWLDSLPDAPPDRPDAAKTDAGIVATALEDGSINPGQMTSFNHYALGAVADWLHREVAGLAPLEPAYWVIRIAPTPLAGLDDASAWHETPHGMASAGWERDGDRIHCRAEVPPNTTAQAGATRGGGHVGYVGVNYDITRPVRGVEQPPDARRCLDVLASQRRAAPSKARTEQPHHAPRARLALAGLCAVFACVARKVVDLPTG